MQINTEPKKFVASAVISELQSSDMYLTLKARLFDLRANLNGVRVTEAFLDEIIENEDKYICIPLYADIRGLIANRSVGHMYNERTGEFYSTQIGSFYHFEKEEVDGNAYLIGYARVMKRNKALCGALTDLFADNALKFSFEISCGSYSEDDDGIVIDADPKNRWEGEAVVTFPACEDAVALDLVAECLGKGDENMLDNEKKIEETAETVESEENREVVSEEAQEAVISEDEKQTEEVAEDTNASVETADTVVVREEHTEIEETHAYNVDTQEEVHQRVIVETENVVPVEISEEKEEDEVSEGEEDKAEESTEEEKKEKVAECDIKSLISELKNEFSNMLKDVIAELKESNENKQTIETAEVKDSEEATVTSEKVEEEAETLVNPFMSSMSLPKKYSLLEEEEKPNSTYNLI